MIIIDLIFFGVCAYSAYINHKCGQRDWMYLSGLMAFANLLALLQHLGIV
jgi:hypothetical protein